MEVNSSASLKKRKIIKWVLIFFIIADAVFIFVNSSLNDKASSKESGKVTNAVIHITHPEYESLSSSEKATLFQNVHNKIRPAAHFIEYVPIGFFGVLLVLIHFGISRKTMIYTSAVFAGGIIYAVSDEIHQHFTDGRASEFGDILTDSLGCLFGIVLAFAAYGIYKSIKTHKKSRKKAVKGD